MASAFSLSLAPPLGDRGDRQAQAAQQADSATIKTGSSISFIPSTSFPNPISQSTRPWKPRKDTATIGGGDWGDGQSLHGLGISQASIFWRTPAKKITIATRKSMPEPKAFTKELQIPKVGSAAPFSSTNMVTPKNGAVGGDQRQVDAQSVIEGRDIFSGE